jgi:hypothetical protein
LCALSITFKQNRAQRTWTVQVDVASLHSSKRTIRWVLSQGADLVKHDQQKILVRLLQREGDRGVDLIRTVGDAE